MIRFLFYIAIILSLLSQLPMVLETGLDRIFKFSWIPLTLVTLSRHPSDFINKKMIFFYLFIFVFGWLMLMLQATTGATYLVLGGDYYNIVVSFLIFINSYIFWKYNGTWKNYNRLVNLIIIGCLILGIVVYIFFLQFAEMTSTVYAYDAKNSLGQILFVGSIMALTNMRDITNRTHRLFLICSIIILITIIMLLKSRGTIICLFFVLAYYMTKYGTIKQRLGLIAIGCIVIIFIFFNSEAYNLIVVNIIFANRSVSSASSLSSGRTALIAKAIEIIDDNLLFGIGHSYFVDCMPISILLQYGIIVLIVVFAFLTYLAIKVSKLQKNNSIDLATFLVFWSFILNSLFEAYPPFGPGVKCFALWMLLGFVFAKKKIMFSTKIY